MVNCKIIDQTADVSKRLTCFYGAEREFGQDQISHWRDKLSSLSEFMLKKKPKAVKGLEGMYSLKRLSEII